MSFPNNPQNLDQVTIQGQLYQYVSAKGAWQKVLSEVPDLFDADTLNGVTGLQFLRSDQADTMQGNLTLTGTLTATANTVLIQDLVVPETGSILVDGATAATEINDQGITADAAEIQNLTVTGPLAINNTVTLTGGDIIQTGGLISTPEVLLDNYGTITMPAEDSSNTAQIQNYLMAPGKTQLIEPGSASAFNTVDSLVDTVNSVDIQLIAASAFGTGSTGGFVSELSAAVSFENFESGTLSTSIWDTGSSSNYNIRTPGAGTGTGGFAAATVGSTRHIEFDTGTGTRQLQTQVLDLSSGNGIYPDGIYGVRYNTINGSGSNGGALVTLAGSEGLQFAVSGNSGSTFTTLIGTANGTTSWSTTTPAANGNFDTGLTVLRWIQQNADGTGLDEIGLDNIELLYRPSQEYYIQIGSKSVSRASSLRLNAVSLFGITGVSVRAIRGDGSNGELAMNVTNNLVLWYSINGGAFVNFGSVTLTNTWADYSFNLTNLGKSVTSDDTSTIVFELRNTNTSNRVFAVKNVAVNYSLVNFLRIRAPNRALISSAQIDFESNTINIGNSTTTGRVVLYSTASSSSVNANNSLFTNGGIYAAGIIRANVGFFGNLSGTASSASFASGASSATVAGAISNSSCDETFFTFTMDGATYASDSIYQYAIPITNSQTTYNSYEITVVGYYYTPSSTTPTLTARFYKHWHFGFHQFPATYVIEGAANIYSYNSDATNFPAGAVGAGKAFASVVSNVLYLNLVQRTAAAVDSATKFSVKISRFIA